MKFENRLEGVRLISFMHVWLSFTGIKIVCSFLKLNCCNLYMLYVSSKGGGLTKHIFFSLFIHSFTCILITVPFYRRKFCDGHIIIVYEVQNFRNRPLFDSKCACLILWFTNYVFTLCFLWNKEKFFSLVLMFHTLYIRWR